MKLQKKSFLVIGLIWLGFIIFICATARYLLLSGYVKSEQEYVQHDLARVDETVKEINYSLFLFTSDWAHWADLYDYMKGKKPNFIADNLSLSVYKDSSINMITFWDNQGNMVYGTGVDTETNQFSNIPYGSGKYKVPRTLLLNYPQHPDSIHGYILSGDKIMLAAASTITNGIDNTQSVGTMITGRLITPTLLKKIGDISQTNLQVYTISEINGNPPYMDALRSSVANNGHFSQPVDDKLLEGFSVINDIFGHPIGFFRMVKNRDIYASGLRAYHNFLTNFLIIALVFSVCMFALIRKVILRRLEKLDEQIADIRAHKKLAARVNVGGTDEVSDVANEFNALLDTIENLHQTYAKHTGDLKEENIKLNQAMTQFKKGDSYYPQPNDHLANLTNYDVLTSLPNRIFFNEIFNKSLLHSKENSKTLSILMLDVDKFRQINTTHGRPIGDMVLKELSSRMAMILRPGDLLARLEGDEFIILLNDITHPKVASSIAEKILHTCMEVIKVDGHDLFVTVSMGISVFPNAANSLEDMVKKNSHYIKRNMQAEACSSISPKK
jgi:diguanylate cyclase (GGDEF)-like protein